MRHVLLASLFVLAAAGTAATSRATAAEPPAADAIERFPASYFADAAPDNAWDMLLRLPGFTVVEPDEDVRGYQAARGNVLVDGAWPASKHDSIAELLKRIPAAAVARIELIRSGAPGFDLGGFPRVANVVRRHDATTTALFEAGVLAASDGWIAPRGRAEYGLRRGRDRLDLSLKIDPELDDDSGHGHVDEAGRVRNWDTRTGKHRGEAGASLRHATGNGELALALALRRERERTDSHFGADTGGRGAQSDREIEDTLQRELDARYHRALGRSATLDLVASLHAVRTRDDERSHDGNETESFRADGDSRENILRAALERRFAAGWSLLASAETAQNTLDSRSRLWRDGGHAELPGSDVRVEERRSETTLVATWSPRASFALDAGLRVERSRIRVDGDARGDRTFVYPKPRLALRFDAGAADRLQLALEREVGQLDFEDFAASASFDSGVVSAGNAALVPDKTWRLGANWEHRFGDASSVAVGWRHERIEDVIDRVMITANGDFFDAPGNIGNGRRDTLSLDLSLPLDGIGFANARLRSSMRWQRSRVTDPVTGAARSISGEKPVDGEIALTQDLPGLATNWGLTVEHIAEREAKYRFDRIERKSEGIGWTLFAEHDLGHRWRLRAEATDLFGRDFRIERLRHDGPRDGSAPASVERRRRTTPGTLTLTLRHN